MIVRLVVVALLAAVLPLVAPTPAAAATITVTTTADVVDGGDGLTSLREAFIAANGSAGLDTIQLQPAAIYTLTIPGALEEAAATGDLDSTDDLVIEGNGSTVDAAGLDRVIDATAPLTVRDLTITGGFVDSSLASAPVRGGGVRATTAVFEGSTIRDNQVQTTIDDPAGEVSGGGIWGDDLTVTNSTVADNTVALLPGSALSFGTIFGGGMVSLDATVTGSTISGNTVRDDSGEEVAVGGGLWVMTLSMSDTTVSANSAIGIGVGGGLAIGTGTLADVSIVDNIVDGSGFTGVGGGVVITDGTITRADISGNKILGGGFDFGGGLAGGTVSLTDSDVYGNSSAYGGGVYSDGDLTIERSTIRGNAATQVGGGVAHLPENVGLGVGSVTVIRDSTVSGNTADRGAGVGLIDFAGGGLPGEIRLERSLVSDNTAVTDGGGLFLDATPSLTASLESSTVSGNAATTGGGLWLGSAVSVTDSTVTANTATTAGGGVWLDPTGVLTATNSAVGGQTVGADCAGSGVAVSSGFNADTDGSCGLGDPTDLTVPSLGLGVLADNGGPTLSHLPLPASALVDSGPAVCLVTDQRGVARPVGVACDRGAIETSYLAPTTTADVVDAGDGVLSLREVFIAANAAPGLDTILLEAAAIYTLTIPGALEGASATGDLDSIEDLIIEGNGATIDANSLDRVIDATAPLTVRNLTITGGFVDSSLNLAPVAGGGVRATTAVFENSTIRNNQVQSTIDGPFTRVAGGGLSGDDLTVTNSTVSENTVRLLPGTDIGYGNPKGGGMSSLDATVTGSTISGNAVRDETRTEGAMGGGVQSESLYMSTTTVSANSALGSDAVGGGVFTRTATLADVNIVANSVDGSYGIGTDSGVGMGAGVVIDDGSITRADISGNDILSSGSGWGGGLAIVGGPGQHVALTDSDVRANTSVDGGGVLSWGDLTVAGSTIRDNTATGRGGGVFSVGSAGVAFVSGTVSGNTADQGGGVFADSVTLTGSAVSDNSTAGSGSVGAGGVQADAAVLVDSAVLRNSSDFVGGVMASTLTLRRSSVSDNSGDSVGGIEAVDVDIVDSLIARNDADFIGGALVGGSDPGGGTIVNSSIVDNSGTAYVGGIEAYASSGLDLAISASTITGNEGEVGNIRHVDSSGEATGPGSVSLSGSVVGDPVGGPDCSLVVPVVSGGSNFDSDGSCGLAGPGDISGGGDPGLLYLGDNGGLTLGRLPLPWSPLVDAAVGCGGLGADQRGVARPQGAACDIGAVELVAGEWSPTFSDVGQGHPFLVEIEWAAALGVAQGWPDGTFRSTERVSRQAVAVWLWRLAGEPAPVGPSPFTDTAGSIFEPAIVWLAEQGVVQGWPDQTFRPTERVSRQAVAAWLWRLAGEPAPVGPSPFTDTAGSPFEPAIVWLAEQGVAQGWPDQTFRPVERVSRQAVAAWVCRYADLGLA